ncbi:MAG: phage virion morphogenesis protein [Proteobacteria bacterium]|nr:phage virion morphogenesis protein [Pseudomonadota bacterium]
MTTFSIVSNDAAVLAALGQLRGRMDDMSPALKEIGEDLTAIVKQTFSTSTSPWGEKWVPNAEATIQAHLGRFSSSYSKKTGQLTATGAQRIQNKKPLIGETRALSTNIYPDVEGNVLTIGSTMKYAAIQNLGGMAGRGKKVRIPARPFMPISESGNIAPVAQQAILEVLNGYLNQP